MEAELAAVRRVTDLHSARLQMIPTAGMPHIAGDSPYSMVDMGALGWRGPNVHQVLTACTPAEEAPISLDDPLVDILARESFEK